MKSAKKILGVVAVVVDVVLSATGCVSGVVDLDDGVDHSRKVEVSASFSRTLPVDEQVAVRITGANGTIRIWGVPGADRVVVEAIRRVKSDSRQDAERHLAYLQVLAQTQAQEVEIRTVQPSQSHGRSYIVDYDIRVPDHLVPSVINGNGSIRLEGFQADVAVQNGNGDVKLVDVTGSSWVSVGNGEISTWTYLPEGGQIVHAIGNGTIFLSVQPQVSASFGAKVGNGTISVTGLDLQQVISSPRQLHGILGSGDGLIDLTTGNGEIRVQGG
jgi:hypothetical protein